MFQFIILLLGITHGFYLSYAIFKKNNKENNANLVLSSFVFLFSCTLFLVFIDITELVNKVPHLIGMNEPLHFLYGPLLYLYVRKLTARHFYKVKLIHFSPFILATLFSIPFFIQDADLKLSFLSDFEQQTQLNAFYLTLFEIVFVPLVFVQLSTYLLKATQRLVVHRRNIISDFSYIEKINLSWLMWLTGMLITLTLFWLVDEVIEVNVAFCMDTGKGIGCDIPWLMADRSFYLAETGVVLCIYFISIYGLKQPKIFDIDLNEQAKNTDAIIVKENAQENVEVKRSEKYKNSSLTSDMAHSVYNDLYQHIADHEVYLEPELSLSQLADYSGFSKHHISQAINQCAEKNFFDFINSLRVDYAKTLLLSSDKMSVQDVALNAGFRSRSAFYNAFKKHTEKTPSQFKVESKP